MWSEFATPETIDSRIWPRNAAIAERLWSPQSVKNPASMYRRMEQVSADLEHVGLKHRSNYRLMLERIANGPDIGPLRMVADVVEPPKNYDRGQLSSYTSLVPLNRLVDAARPESETARRFGEAVSEYLKTKSAAKVNELRTHLERWRDNDTRVQAMLGRSYLMAEVGPVSAELKDVAMIGLEALDRGKDATWALEGLARLKKAQAPQSEVLIMIVPHVRRLVEAAAAR
jgi:hexosaminidase